MDKPSFRFDQNRKIFSHFRNSTQNDILRIFVFARNQKGRSQGFFITEYHLGNYNKQVGDHMKQFSHPSLITLGFLTFSMMGLTIIASLYLKSKKVKKSINREDQYNTEARCSLLKQDTFKVSQSMMKDSKWNFINFCSFQSYRATFFIARSSSQRAQA